MIEAIGVVIGAIVMVVLIVVAISGVIVWFVRDRDDDAPVKLESPSASRAPSPVDRKRRR